MNTKIILTIVILLTLTSCHTANDGELSGTPIASKSFNAMTLYDSIKSGLVDSLASEMGMSMSDEEKAAGIRFMDSIFGIIFKDPDGFAKGMEDSKTLHIFPNPTNSYVDVELLKGSPLTFPVNEADFQLFYENTKIADLHFSGIVKNAIRIDESYLQKSGVYTLTTNFLGENAPLIGSFVVSKGK
jgi:hypothetical protein